MSSRRAWLGLSLGAAGCGFRPLYAPAGPERDGGPEVEATLAAIRVGNIPERFGQLVRRDLERRLDRRQAGRPARYLLEAAVTFNVDTIGYRRDGTATRQRFTAIGNWALSTLSVPPERVAGSSIPLRVIDGYNIPDLQFFAADTAREAMERRLAEAVSEEIARQLTLALRQGSIG